MLRKPLDTIVKTRHMVKRFKRQRRVKILSFALSYLLWSWERSKSESKQIELQLEELRLNKLGSSLEDENSSNFNMEDGPK